MVPLVPEFASMLVVKLSVDVESIMLISFFNNNRSSTGLNTLVTRHWMVGGTARGVVAPRRGSNLHLAKLLSRQELTQHATVIKIGPRTFHKCN